jgi:hypothetical protein
MAQPSILAEHPYLSQTTLYQFCHAYALVSSRAFIVDGYHGLAMVPIADALVVVNLTPFDTDSVLKVGSTIPTTIMFTWKCVLFDSST